MMPPAFEIHKLPIDEPEDGVTLTDLIAGMAIMFFVIGTALFFGGWIG